MTKLQAQVVELKWFDLGLNSFWSTWAIISCIQSGFFYQITLFQRRNPQKSFSFGSVHCKPFVDFKSNQDGMLRKQYCSWRDLHVEILPGDKAAEHPGTSLPVQSPAPKLPFLRIPARRHSDVETAFR